ncbi:MAG: GntR family transcriptional regulator [Desulfobacteraceae bacterium]|nr:GntR family transcriptional regulator [Desulfobacteraceae bacterium]
MAKSEVKPLREEIYNQLIQDIVSGRINPGEKLPELELCKKFNVSRTPIREALFQLEQDGWINIIKNRGAVVEKIGFEKIEELYDLIALLEEHATRIAVEGKITKKEISQLKKLQKEMEQCASDRNFFKYIEKNSEFHEFFVRKCGNETLAQITMDFRRKVYSIIARGFTLPAYIDYYAESHEKIINAVSEKNSVKAAKLMKEHTLDAKRFFLKERLHQ